MDEPRKSRFDLSLMGKADRHNLSATFCEAILRFYDDPVNRKRAEELIRQREARYTAATAEVTKST